MTVGQLSVLSWCPSPSLRAQKQEETACQHQLLPLHRDSMGALVGIALGAPQSSKQTSGAPQPGVTQVAEQQGDKQQTQTI